MNLVLTLISAGWIVFWLLAGLVVGWVFAIIVRLIRDQEER